MSTEITDIQRWTKEYNNPTSEKQWRQAFDKLQKVHKKYGTIKNY